MSVNQNYYESDAPARLDYWRYMAAPRARVSRIVREVRRVQPVSLVDLGCGDGSLLDEIGRSMPGVRLAGIDLSRMQIERNRDRRPEIEWMAADLQEPLTPARRFEAVVASEVIEHLDEPSMLLRNAAVLAEAGGLLVVTTQSGPVRETERRVGHVRHFAAGDLSRMLERSGWTPLRVWNEGFPFHDLSKWWANRDAEATMARFGGSKPYGAREKAVCLALRAAFLLNSRSRGAQLYAIAERSA